MYNNGNTTIHHHPSAMDRYLAALGAIPAPGGNGCHPHLLRVANLGRNAGITAEQVAVDIATHIPAGTRVVGEREIWDAINLAFSNTGTGQSPSMGAAAPRTVAPVLVDGARIRQQLITIGRALLAAAGVRTPDDLRGRPGNLVPTHTADRRQEALLLLGLYPANDRLFIGDTYDSGSGCVRSAAEWMKELRDYAATTDRIGLTMDDSGGMLGGRYPFIQPNPLTGVAALTKDGKLSWHCDAAVCTFRYAVGEFDNLPLEDQLAVWTALSHKGVPIAALIHSGGKSIHAWIRVDVPDRATWERGIEDWLFTQYLVPIGCDPACRNESRKSRLPGVIRPDKGTWQTAIWISDNPLNGKIV